MSNLLCGKDHSISMFLMKLYRYSNSRSVGTDVFSPDLELPTIQKHIHNSADFNKELDVD